MEHCDDGRYIIFDGRCWRATNPNLPTDVAAALRRQLMAARQAAGVSLRAQDPEAELRARAGVQRAKKALGERGTPLWEQSPAERRARWELGLDDPLPEPKDVADKSSVWGWSPADSWGFEPLGANSPWTSSPMSSLHCRTVSSGRHIAVVTGL